jgi:MFS family permease
LIVLVDVLGMTIMIPLLPFYAVHFGASATVVGLLMSSYAFCQLIAGPFLGNWSDRMGRRKPLLIVSQLGTFAGFLILAFATSLPVIFLARIIDGLTAGNLSLAQAYIADVTEPKNRAKSFALIGIAFGIGFVVGPAISGFLAQYGYTYPIFAAAALSATSVVCTATLLPKTEPRISTDTGASGPAGQRLGLLEWKRYAEYFARPGLGRLLWEFFFFAFPFSLFFGGFALYANQRYRWNGHAVGTHEVSYVLIYVGVLGVILQGGLIGRMVKKFGERALVRSGFLCAGIGYGLLAWTRTIAQLLGASTINSYGMGVLRPSITAMISHKAGKNEQGVVLGLTQSITSISSVIAPVIAGTLIDRHMLSAWALLIAAFSFAGLILGLIREDV